MTVYLPLFAIIALSPGSSKLILNDGFDVFGSKCRAILPVYEVLGNLAFIYIWVLFDASLSYFKYPSVFGEVGYVLR